MPHRATYFFPRRFPDRSEDETSKQILDHENNKIVNSSSIKSSDTFAVESDPPKKQPTVTPTTNKNDVVFSSPNKHSAVSDLFKLPSKRNQISAFRDWFNIEKKGDTNPNRSSNRLKSYSNRHEEKEEEEDRELLLPPEIFNDAVSAVDRSFDRQVSLPRFSSGSSYAGSLFSGTATFSSDVTKDDKSSSSCRASTAAATRRHVEEVEDRNGDGYARKYKESNYLQVAMTKRIACLASLAPEPVLTLDSGSESWDAESVSYRLWVRKRIKTSSFMIFSI